MKKIILLLTVSVALVFTSCSKLNTDTYDATSFVADTDLTALQPLLKVQNIPLEWTSVGNSNKSTQATYSLVLDWTLNSPLSANNTTSDPLSASSVEEQGDYVYVGFHDYGLEFYGSILVVDKSKNLIAGAVHSEFIDVNDLEINETLFPNTLFIAGESNKRGSEALKMATTSGVLSAAAGIGMPIFGASANSITAVGTNKLWVSCGGTNGQGMKGGLIVLDPTLTLDPVTLFTQDNAKHFDADNTSGKGLWIHGNNSDQTKLYVFESLPAQTSTSATIGTAVSNPVNVTALGKNAVDVDGNFGFVAMGANGVYKINLTGTPGSVAQHFELPGTYAGLANGVKTDGTYVYVACGADGLVVLDYDLNFVGQWNGDTVVNGDTNGSCNYVDIGNESVEGTKVLYVAFGVGGLRKITMTVTP